MLLTHWVPIMMLVLLNLCNLAVEVATIGCCISKVLVLLDDFYNILCWVGPWLG